MRVRPTDQLLLPTAPDQLRRPMSSSDIRVLIEQAEINAERAALAGEQSGHRVYRLITDRSNQPERPLRFITFGCQGSADDEQRKVAARLNDLCTDPTTRPDFILILGDNVYETGAESADDQKIRECFYNIYLKYPHLNNIPFFLLQGNHDQNRHNKALPLAEQGVVRGMHEVAHSFLGDNKFDADGKAALYNLDTLPLNQLPSWNMPRRYYALIVDDVQIFCLDSNTYIKDYLNFCADPVGQTALNNQAVWTQEEAAKAIAQGRKIVLSQHHPLYTPGKRAYHNDLKIYLSRDDINNVLPARLPLMRITDKTSYNAVLKEILRMQALEFDLVLAAHDHNMYYYNNKNQADAAYKICQITSGGGGGKLQERIEFSEQKRMGCFMQQTGIVSCEHRIGEPHFNFTFYTSNREHQLEFTSLEARAVIHHTDAEQEASIDCFLAIIESALNDYLEFIGNRQEDTQGGFFSRNASHGPEGAERAHQLWAYIKHAHPDSLERIIEQVYKSTERKGLTSAKEHSLITIINKKMKETFFVTMQEFAYQYGAMSPGKSY
jgi:hypothetical protein